MPERVLFPLAGITFKSLSEKWQCLEWTLVFFAADVAGGSFGKDTALGFRPFLSVRCEANNWETQPWKNLPTIM